MEGGGQEAREGIISIGNTVMILERVYITSVDTQNKLVRQVLSSRIYK